MSEEFLSGIQNFNARKLKKTVTNDRSAPVLPGSTPKEDPNAPKPKGTAGLAALLGSKLGGVPSGGGGASKAMAPAKVKSVVRSQGVAAGLARAPLEQPSQEGPPLPDLPPLPPLNAGDVPPLPPLNSQRPAAPPRIASQPLSIPPSIPSAAPPRTMNQPRSNPPSNPPSGPPSGPLSNPPPFGPASSPPSCPPSNPPSPPSGSPPSRPPPLSAPPGYPPRGPPSQAPPPPSQAPPQQQPRTAPPQQAQTPPAQTPPAQTAQNGRWIFALTRMPDQCPQNSSSTRKTYYSGGSSGLKLPLALNNL